MANRAAERADDEQIAERADHRRQANDADVRHRQNRCAEQQRRTATVHRQRQLHRRLDYSTHNGSRTILIQNRSPEAKNHHMTYAYASPCLGLNVELHFVSLLHIIAASASRRPQVVDKRVTGTRIRTLLTGLLRRHNDCNG